MDFTVKYDIAVVGAGIAGVAAALAAARRGHKVVLIEKQTIIGGLATSGLIYIYLPLCDGYGNQVIKSIPEELLLKSMEFSQFDLHQKWNGANISKIKKRSDRYRVEFSPAGFTLTLDEMLLEAGVDLWLDTRVCAVQKSGDKVTALEVENTSGRGVIQAGAFVDASGEAIVVRRADGAVESDYNSLSLWMIESTPEAEQAAYYFGGSLMVRSLKFSDNDIQPGAGMSGKEVTAYTQRCYKHLREFYRESYKKLSRYEHYPVHLPAMQQFRKIAAAKCQYMLNTGDAGKYFEDSVGLTGDWRHPAPVWETPLRSLIPESMDGVFTAGRCMGTIGEAWEVYRVIPTAAMTGEAAGVAAALTLETNCESRSLDYKIVQDALRKNNVPLHLDEINQQPK